MIDPRMSLAMSMHANPGVYALLLGSGLSRSAGIPTGWDIVLDLTRKLARLSEADCGADPAAWYHSEFGHDPDYSTLLDAIAKSPSERQQLLRSYFEPDESEREQGLKLPTAAHRGIARLVADGYCRVILTTNFDRLIERAIEDEGVSPTVIATPDRAKGALPLVHQRCCVIKLNGDYRDTRLKNTPDELSEYDERIARLLDQVLDEFGLIVCGWSAKWDTALRAAIERCPTRRFTLWWTARGNLNDHAKQLVDFRKGQVLMIEDADKFFTRLSEFVTSLRDSQREPPESVQATVALEKRYLSEPRYFIALNDLIVDETERSHRRLVDYNADLLATSSADRDTAKFSRTYREIVETLMHLLIHGCAFGGAEHHSLWAASVEWIASQPKPQSGTVLTEAVRLYPVAILFYAGGLTAMARGHHRLLSCLLTKPKIQKPGGRASLLLAMQWWDMAEWMKEIEKHSKQYTPLSEHLFEVLREPLRRYLPGEVQYEDCFDRFEYLRSLVYADLLNKRVVKRRFSEWSGPPGRFCWRRHRAPESSVIALLDQEAEAMGEDLPWLKCGLFDGSLERFKAVKAGFDEIVASLPW